MSAPCMNVYIYASSWLKPGAVRTQVKQEVWITEH